MNVLSKKQQSREAEKRAEKLQDNGRWQLHCAYRDKRKTTPWDKASSYLMRSDSRLFIAYFSSII